MPYFKWSGIDMYGSSRSGKLFARSAQELDHTLFRRDIALLKCRSVAHISFMPFSSSVHISFFRQMTTLLNAGLLVPDACEVMIQLMERSVLFQSVIAEIVEDIKQGSSMHEACLQHPIYFDSTTCAIIRAGEESGALSGALAAIAARLQTRALLLQSIRSAAMMPIITACFFVMMVIFTCLFIVPAFAALFVSMGSQIPWTTNVLLRMSEWLSVSYFIVGMSVVCGVGYGMYRLVNSVFLKPRKDVLVLKIPFMKRWIILSNHVFFFESLALLVAQGVHVIPALLIAKQTVSNAVLFDQFCALEQEVISGISLQAALRMTMHEHCSPDVIALIAVGEESGTLSSMLSQAAQIQRDKLMRLITVSSALVQPVLLLVLGLLIAALLGALYVPLFHMPSMT